MRAVLRGAGGGGAGPLRPPHLLPLLRADAGAVRRAVLRRVPGGAGPGEAGTGGLAAGGAGPGRTGPGRSPGAGLGPGPRGGGQGRGPGPGGGRSWAAEQVVRSAEWSGGAAAPARGAGRAVGNII